MRSDASHRSQTHRGLLLHSYTRREPGTALRQTVGAVRTIQRLCLAAMAVALLAAFAPAVSALECRGIPLVDGGCLFTVTGGDSPNPDDGFAVTNAHDVPLWDFVKSKDLDALGYPISQRWVDGPFTLQAFQKVILQWDPDKGRMNYYNTLDALANRYPDVELPYVPAHQVLAADRGADFQTITRNHLALLEQHQAIKERFLAEPNWLNLYGLPIRYEEREVDDHPQGVQMLRTQRAVFVVWNVPAPGTTVGRVILQNVPDKVKRLHNVIIPDAAEVPASVCQVRALPTFTIASPAWAIYESAVFDRDFLVDLYHATGGADWTNSENWLDHVPLSSWHGVTTDDRGAVVELDLHDNNLSGSVPGELGCLAGLRSLKLSGNSLSGSIPAELGQLHRLHRLHLNGNALTGPIPSQLGLLSRLTELRLAYNHLHGRIPTELGRLAQLEELDLGHNSLSGTIPAQLGWLTGLVALDLSRNELSGAIPAELSNLRYLSRLELDDNNLAGSIPKQIGKLNRLYRLNLGGNGLFFGCLPGHWAYVPVTDVNNLNLAFCLGSGIDSNDGDQECYERMIVRRGEGCVITVVWKYFFVDIWGTAHIDDRRADSSISAGGTIGIIRYRVRGHMQSDGNWIITRFCSGSCEDS